MRELILTIEWGGLGDHLFWSHIPRIAKTTGAYDRVLLDQASPFRHHDYTLIWRLNPYFDGFTVRPGRLPVPVGPADVSEELNLLDRHMLNLGLDDGVRGHEPEFYYTPTVRPEVAGLVVYDPNYVSGVGRVDPANVRTTMAGLGLPVDAETVYRAKHHGLDTSFRVATDGLLSYCDLIHSARAFACLTSGGATLAAALGRPCHVFHGDGQPAMFRHSRLHTYHRA